ncbi:MAG: ComEA family DNA-binding protein [Bacteroidota bacterium]
MPLWKDFFTFSRRERSGILVLLSLILLVFTANQLVGVFYQNNIPADFTAFEKDIEEFEKGVLLDLAENKKSEKNNSPKIPPKKKHVLHAFNPNTVSRDELLEMGFSSKTSSVIVNFRNKGGKFYEKEDFQKIYGITDSVYAAVIDYITLPEELNIAEKKVNSSSPEIINLNTADTTMLKSLPGIGSKLAGRIIVFRNALGGFYSISQLSEVYGLKPEVIENNKHQLAVSGEVKKININSCTAEELKKHPYIGKWNIANAIVNYRQLHGAYKTVSDVKKTDLVNEDLYPKLAPYLSVE